MLKKKVVVNDYVLAICFVNLGNGVVILYYEINKAVLDQVFKKG